MATIDSAIIKQGPLVHTESVAGSNQSCNVQDIHSGRHRPNHVTVEQRIGQQILQHQQHRATNGSYGHFQIHSQNPVNQSNVSNDLDRVRGGPNLAPGWQRFSTNGQITYVSPTGAEFKTIDAVKNYLLSPGTCKCGLPCPLKPDFFFEFNSKIPNLPLKVPNVNNVANTSCLHQARPVDRQQKSNDGKFRHIISIDGSIVATSTTTVSSNQSSSTTHTQSITSPLQTVVPSRKLVPPDLGRQIVQMPLQTTTSIYTGVESKKVANIPVSRSPPWRKSSLINQQKHTEKPHPIIGQQVPMKNDQRVPPLPQQHLQLQQAMSVQQQPGTQSNVAVQQTAIQQPPPWQEEVQKRRSTKKRPNFKEDPTGYLDHQTAILQSSILNVHSPDLQMEQQNHALNSQRPQQTVQKISRPQESINENVTDVIYSQSDICSQFVDQQNQPNLYMSRPMGNKSIPSGPVRFVTSDGQVLYQNATNFRSNDSQITRSSQAIPIVSQSNEIYLNQSRPLRVDEIVTTENQFGNQGQFDRFVSETRRNQTTTDDRDSYPATGMVQFKQQQHLQLQQQIQQQNQLFRHTQQQMANKIKYFDVSGGDHVPVSVPGRNVSRAVTATQESPVSSSTAYRNSRMDGFDGIKGPQQVGAVSTSNEHFHHYQTISTSPSPPGNSPKLSPSAGSVQGGRSTTVTSNTGHVNNHKLNGTPQTSGRNTITSVLAGKTMTSVSQSGNNYVRLQDMVDQQSTAMQYATIEPNRGGMGGPSSINVTTNVPQSIQLQQICRESSGNQFIMTSSGQILLMPSGHQTKSGSNQMIIGNQGGTIVVNNSPQSVVLNQPSRSQLIGQELVSEQRLTPAGTGNVVIPAGGQSILHGSNNVLTNNSNFIVNSQNNIHPMIINNTNLNVAHTNVIQAGGNNLITANGKVLSNSRNLPNILSNQTNVLTNNHIINGATGSANLISPNSGTVVLNTLPSGYMLQPQQFTTVDGQVVNVISPEGTTTQYIQQTQQRIILSPDSKRRIKKRKSGSQTPPTPIQSLSPASPSQHSPRIVSQAGQSSTLLQITPQYQSQSFQISSGVPGIHLLQQNKSATNAVNPQQQIILQNGQTILQPLNLISQQLLVPAGVMVSPADATTLLQIQNVGQCGQILASHPHQGITIRDSSPVQHKSFLSPNSGGQQFIVSGNGQISPIGQVYSTPVGLVVPHSSNGSYVQQNATIVQQQSDQDTIVTHSVGPGKTIQHIQHVQQRINPMQHPGSVSPPDTTTHSPRSPDRPPSHRSGASDTNMVQCVSSSEPDSVVSPVAEGSSPSPSHTDIDRNNSQISCNQQTIYKPAHKIRRIQISNNQYLNRTLSQARMRPDSHDNSPTTNSITTSTAPFSMGELVWGAARGHPAWPGKIVPGPDGQQTIGTDTTWVRWFGGRPNIELVSLTSLISLSDGLDAHHRAQKDTRKSRKLNSQLESAIQEAMAELDPAPATPPTKNCTYNSKNISKAMAREAHQHRNKPVKIAPAPSNVNVRPSIPTAAPLINSTAVKCLRFSSKPK